MEFDIEKFISAVRVNDMARKARFKVELTPPAAIVNNTGINVSVMSMFCESAVFPELTINAETQYIWGPLIHRPKTISYGGFMVLQFYLDEDMAIKRMFDYWLQSIVDGEQYTVSYQRDYVAPLMRITQLDKNDQPTYIVNLTDVFPAGVIQLDVNHSLQNAVHLLQVSFRFRKWESLAFDPEFGFNAVSTKAGTNSLEKNGGAFTRNNSLEKNTIANKPVDQQTVIGGNIFRLPPKP